MKITHLLLAASLLSSGTALAQTTPSTTKTTNTVGLGGTVQGSTQDGNNANGTPARYDDRNSGLPSESSVKLKSIKPKRTKHSDKTKSTM